MQTGKERISCSKPSLFPILTEFLYLWNKMRLKMYFRWQWLHQCCPSQCPSLTCWFVKILSPSSIVIIIIVIMIIRVERWSHHFLFSSQWPLRSMSFAGSSHLHHHNHLHLLVKSLGLHNNIPKTTTQVLDLIHTTTLERKRRLSFNRLSLSLSIDLRPNRTLTF